MNTLGIDIGGSGIKGAVVDTDTGALLTDRVRIPTPEKAKPADVAKVVAELVHGLDYKGTIGCGFPAVVLHGVVKTAANIHESWIGVDAAGLFANSSGNPTLVVNDADAAGVAEIAFGAGKGVNGVVLMFTLGTGIGSAIFVDGKLVPNSEFGHFPIRGKDAETRASDATRKRKELSYKAWAKRLQEYFTYMENLFWPDLIIVGGGVSKYADEFLPLLKLRTKILPAQLQNQAGIIGAAVFAAK